MKAKLHKNLDMLRHGKSCYASAIRLWSSSWIAEIATFFMSENAHPEVWIVYETDVILKKKTTHIKCQFISS